MKDTVIHPRDIDCPAPDPEKDRLYCKLKNTDVVYNENWKGYIVFIMRKKTKKGVIWKDRLCLLKTCKM